MALALEKDIAIRIFLREIDDIEFTQLVNHALKSWKVVDPIRGSFGIAVNEFAGDNVFKLCDYSDCKICLLGAMYLNKSRYDFNLLDTTKCAAITSGFDNLHYSKYHHKFGDWAAEISRIVFS